MQGQRRTGLGLDWPRHREKNAAETYGISSGAVDVCIIRYIVDERSTKDGSAKLATQTVLVSSDAQDIHYVGGERWLGIVPRQVDILQPDQHPIASQSPSSTEQLVKSSRASSSTYLTLPCDFRPEEEEVARRLLCQRVWSNGGQDERECRGGSQSECQHLSTGPSRTTAHCPMSTVRCSLPTARLASSCGPSRFTGQASSRFVVYLYANTRRVIVAVSICRWLYRCLCLCLKLVTVTAHASSLNQTKKRCWRSDNSLRVM